MNPLDNAIESTASLLFLLQLIFLFYFDNFGLNIFILGIGWLMLVPSFLLLNLSFMALRTYGKILDERGLADTTVIIRKGVYGIVRHPLYLGWILMSISLLLITQNWLSSLCGIILTFLVVIIIRHEDMTNVLKFGNDYLQYQNEVPLVNILRGLWRYSRRKNTS